MNDALDFWENKHRGYAAKSWITLPNALSDIALGTLPPRSHVLELGSGQGCDAAYLAQHGHRVLATDFSPYALEHFPADADVAGVERMQLDVTDVPYPFETGSYDAVYAHLSLHYFSQEITRAIFADVARLLRPGGWLITTFNSVRDDENGLGRRIEDRYFELSEGDRKRFFSVEEMPTLLGEQFVVKRAEYGRGTRKNPDDEFVLVLAQTKEGSS